MTCLTRYGRVASTMKRLAPPPTGSSSWSTTKSPTAVTSDDTATFEVILYETSNNILMQYQDVILSMPAFDQGASATVGIQGDTSQYLQYSCNTAALNDNLAILYAVCLTSVQVMKAQRTAPCIISRCRPMPPCRLSCVLASGATMHMRQQRTSTPMSILTVNTWGVSLAREDCGTAWAEGTWPLTEAQIEGFADAGSVSVTIQNGPNVDICGTYDQHMVRLCYSRQQPVCVSYLVGDKDQEGATGDHPIVPHEDEDLDGFDMHMEGRTIEYMHYFPYSPCIESATLKLAIVGFNDQDDELDNRLFIEGDEIPGAFEGSSDGWELFTFDIDPSYLDDQRLDVAVAAHDHYGNDRTEGWGGIDYSELVVCGEECTLDITKDWVDLNGGDVEPGDTIRYYIGYANYDVVPSDFMIIVDDYDEDMLEDIGDFQQTSGHFTLPPVDDGGVMRWQYGDCMAVIPVGETGWVSYTAVVKNVTMDTEVTNEACLLAYESEISDEHLEVCDGSRFTVQAKVVQPPPLPPLTEGKPFDDPGGASWAQVPTNPSYVRISNVNAQQTAQTGQPMTIFANVTNRGDIPGNYTATLMINGQMVEEKTGSLDANKARPLQFTYTPMQPGQYEVDINGQKAYFISIGEAPVQPMGTTQVTYILLFCLAFIAIVLGILLYMRRGFSRQ